MSNAQVPPQALDAEVAVLRALISGADVYDEVSSMLTVDDFYRDQHRIIYNAIQNIERKNRRVDQVLLAEELTKMDKMDVVGGVAYLNSLAEYQPSFNVTEHARIVAEKAQRRRLIDAGNKIIGMGYDVEEETEVVVSNAEKMVLSVSGQVHGDESFTPMGDVVLESIQRISDLQKLDGTLTGLSCGFRDLDECTSGLQPSDLILVAARPSMGKTAFTLNIAQNVAVKGNKSVAFFSLEMSKEQLVNRILSSIAEVSSQKLRTGQLEQDDWDRVIQASERMSNAPLYIDDTPGLTVQQMRAKLRRLKVSHGLDLVIVDYIQLMQGGGNGRNGENRQQEISDISRNLKLIARELNVPVIALSQLSRSVEARPDKRPILSDLRESGSLEQDADIVAFLYREKYYDPNTDRGDITEIIIRKHRNGALKTVELMFQGEFTRFRDVSYRENPT